MRLAALLLAPLGLLAQAPQAAQAPCGNTPAYSTCELTFELPEKDAAAYANPYAGVELKIDFRSRRRTYAMPGFWDGGRRFVVRFAPPEAGAWDYRVTSNVSAWDGKAGNFTVNTSDAPGFVRPVSLHHWAYTERNLPHLWMGASEPRLAFLDDAAFKAIADARAAQKFTHVRTQILGEGPDAGAFDTSGSPSPGWFQRLDHHISDLNRRGIVADLVLASRPAVISRNFRTQELRRRFVQYIVARYGAMNVTWLLVQEFEGELDARDLLKEVGLALKSVDPYDHARSSGARVTSAPLLDDGWMTYVTYGFGANDAVGAVEHQLYPAPFVNGGLGREDSGAGKFSEGDADDAALRRRLWNATMNGQSPTYANTGFGPQYANAPGTKAMTAWFDLFSATRYWEMEPYFDVDGGRALALEDTDYIVYVEKPGRVELMVEKHSYDVSWMDPATGEIVKEKKQFSGDRFSGEPPQKTHDWVLRLVRSAHLASLGRSYKFESRSGEEGSRALPIALQEIETSPAKVPFQIEQPSGDISLPAPAPYAATITRQTRATSAMTWLWTGEVTADGQGYRVLATDAKGQLHPPEGLARNLPATLLIRLYGMNANGKVYELTKACGLVK